VALSKTTTRKRDTIFTLGNGKATYTSPTGVKSVSTASLGNIKGTQVTASEGHPFRSRKRGSTDDLGGDFTTVRSYCEGDNSSHRLFRQIGVKEAIEYVGPIYPTVPANMLFPSSVQSSDAALNVKGATLVARCKPTNSVADASVFLGELLKDGLPNLVGHTLWKDRTSKAKKASEEYLNAEFGWKPLLNDINKFAYAVSHASAVLKQYERDAGKVVRRNCRLSTVRTVSTLESAVNNTVYYSPEQGSLHDGSGGSKYLRTRETVRDQWFSGAFTYHLPSGSDSRSSMDRYALEANKLLGLSLTPETLWNLAPWSWAVDWFSNTGDVVSNISSMATDGLVMRYGYIMEHTTVRDTYTLGKTGLRDLNFRVSPFTLVTETKVRRKANPFGFGVSWSGLSPRQLAITVALGITKR